MPAARTRADACPGALSTHPADDGELARVRLPGGVLTAAQLRVLATAADALATGELHLTSRGNVQLRAVRDPADLAHRLTGAGLLPSPTHERVRNILASPLPGVLDAVPMAGELDRAVCADEVLADLPGRFLWAVDAGAGDVAGEDADACWRALTPEVGVLLLGGASASASASAGAGAAAVRAVGVPAAGAVAALTQVARAFVRVRGDAWRIRELPAELLEEVLAAVESRADVAWYAGKYYQPAAAGPFSTTNHPGQHADAVVAAAPLGVLTAAQATVLADVAPHGVLITPWRSVMVRAAGPGVLPALRAAGLLVDPQDPRAQVSACIGRPGCAKARADVRADATRAAAAAAADARAEAAVGGSTRRVHFAGCERRCGRPRSGAIDVLAMDGGYRVDGDWVPAADLAESLRRRA